MEKRRSEINRIMRETEGLVIYHDFYDVPYSEDEIFVYYDDEIKPLSSVSSIVSSLKSIKKGIIGYHEKAENEVSKLTKLLEECQF